VSEHLIERMLIGGATKIGFVISPGKSDILEYYGGRIGEAQICYFVQRQPSGLCDAIFQTLPFIAPDEHAIVGLPDTLWFPIDGLTNLGDDGLSFLLFPVARPEFFDAVVTDGNGRVLEIQVKQPGASSKWIWGAFKLSGAVMRELHELWCRRDPRDEYIGTLVNAYLALGGRAAGVRAGEAYVDVGTLNGYREANQLLDARGHEAASAFPPLPLKAVSPLL
jgi:glucose-1-phosphate thymidylyltransferase